MGKLDKLRGAGPRISAKKEIESVTRLMEEVKAASESQEIPIDKIQLNPHNDYAKEDTEESIRDFASVIAEQGLLHNLVVSEHIGEDGNPVYMLLSGERRLKAIRLLREDEKQPATKWKKARCLILRDLTPRQEMLFLDSANLETRGGVGDSPYMRKALTRYISNIEEEYGVSETAAKGLAERLGINRRTINRNFAIEKKAYPGLKSLLDAGKLNNTEVLLLSALDEETQILVAETVKNLTDNQPEIGMGEGLRRFKTNLPMWMDSPNFIEQNNNVKAGCKEVLALAQAQDIREPLPENPPATEKPEEGRGEVPVDISQVKRSRYLAKCDKMMSMATQWTGTAARKGFDSLTSDQRGEISDKLDEIIRTLTYVRDGLK